MKTVFYGTYYKRSSKGGTEVPSETTITQLNPNRTKRILAVRPKWKNVLCGTFNVRVNDSVYNEINKIMPVLVEDKKDVIYPKGFEYIPEKRNGYLYWKCKISFNGKTVKGLWRAGRIRIDGVGEVFSDKFISDYLGVKEGDTVKVVVYGEPKPIEDKANIIIPQKTNNRNIKTIFDLKDTFINSHIFLICSGKSFNELDKNPLRFVMTMCVNNAPKACMPYFRPNIWTSVDNPDKFLYTIWADPKIMKLVPDGHINKPLWNSDLDDSFGNYKVSDMPNIYTYPRNNIFNPETFLTESTVNWGCGENICGNCQYIHQKRDERGKKIKFPDACPKCGAIKSNGGRSVFIASLRLLYELGFRNVYLLGVDFEMKVNEPKYSFEEDKTPRGVAGNNSSYMKMEDRFKKLRPIFEKNGFMVYNCNKNSRLTAFEYLPYEEALKRAMWFVDDWRKYINNEREKTLNLYQTRWFVCPQCRKNQRVDKESVKSGSAKCQCGMQITKRDLKKHAKIREKTDN